MTTTTGTCAANCWYAKEVDCRCSCGGRNHGCLLNADGEMKTPRRNCTILGSRYVLGRVGTYNTCVDALRTFIGSLDRETYGVRYGSYLSMPTNKRGALVWTKTASKVQEDWDIVAAYQDAGAVTRNGYTRKPRATLLWVREDLAAAFDAMEG